MSVRQKNCEADSQQGQDRTGPRETTRLSTFSSETVARTYIIRDRQRLTVAMSSAQSELEVAKRALKIAEIELSEARSCIYELIISIETVTADRQRLESDIASLNFDLVDAQRGRREAEKRVDRVQLEVNRLRHELRRALHRSCENHHAVGFVSKPLPAKIPRAEVRSIHHHCATGQALRH